MSSGSDFVAEVTAAVAQARAARGESPEWYRVLEAMAALPAIRAIDRWHVARQEYEVAVQQPVDTDELAALAWVAPLGLSCAPTVVAQIRIDGGAVIVRRYAAVAGETVEPVRLIATKLRPEACARLIEEVGVIAARGKVLGDTRIVGWKYGTTSGTIVLGDWRRLIDGDEAERAEMVERVREQTKLQLGPLNRA